MNNEGREKTSQRERAQRERKQPMDYAAAEKGRRADRRKKGLHQTEALLYYSSMDGDLQGRRTREEEEKVDSRDIYYHYSRSLPRNSNFTVHKNVGHTKGL